VVTALSDGLAAHGHVVVVAAVVEPGISTEDHPFLRRIAEGPAELRVYNAARREVARCATTTQDCAVARVGARTELSLRVRLDTRGSYTSLVFSPPLGGASEGLDVDAVMASRAQIATASAEVGPVQ